MYIINLKASLFKLVIIKFYILCVVWSHKFLYMIQSLGCTFFVAYGELRMIDVIFLVSVPCFICVNGCLIHTDVFCKLCTPR
jgi:hypothetical protein